MFLFSLNTYPLHVAVKAENVEDFVCVHLHRLQTVHHDHWGVRMGAVLARGWRRGAITGSSKASSPSPPHWRAHATALIVWGWRGAIALVITIPSTT